MTTPNIEYKKLCFLSALPQRLDFSVNYPEGLVGLSDLKKLQITALVLVFLSRLSEADTFPTPSPRIRCSEGPLLHSQYLSPTFAPSAGTRCSWLLPSDRVCFWTHRWSQFSLIHLVYNLNRWGIVGVSLDNKTIREVCWRILEFFFLTLETTSAGEDWLLYLLGLALNPGGAIYVYLWALKWTETRLSNTYSYEWPLSTESIAKPHWTSHCNCLP